MRPRKHQIEGFRCFERIIVSTFRFTMQDLPSVHFLFALHHDGQAIDDDVEKTPHHQTPNANQRNTERRLEKSGV